MILIFQIKPIQTYVTSYVLEEVSNKTNFEISLRKVGITWLDHAIAYDLLVLDNESDTLLYTEEISVNYRILDLINQNFLNIQRVSSSNLELHLVKYDSLSPLNLISFLNSLRNDDEQKQKDKKGITVEELNVHGLRFLMDDRTKDSVLTKFDFSHFDFLFDEFLIGNFELNNDSIQLTIDEIIGEDYRQGLSITDFSGELFLSNQMLSLTDIDFNTPQSHLSDSIKLYYNGLDDLSHFIDSVSFGFYLSNSKFSKDDLDLILGDIGLKSDVSFDGIMWGSVGDFNIEQSRLGFGLESYMMGGVSCFGLPNVKSTFLLADILDAHLVEEDVEPYLGKLSANLAGLGRLDFTGSFAGFLNDFVARGDFFTDKGSVHSDINLKIPENRNLTSYSGNLSLKKVDIGAFIGNRALVQEVNLNGYIEGVGITSDNAHFDLDALFTNSSIQNYKYDTIYAKGEFSANLFSGKLKISDPNCRISGDADFNLNKGVEKFEMTMKVDSVHLDQLLLIEDSLFTRGEINAYFSSLNLDEFVGEINVKNGLIRVGQRKLYVDSLGFTADLEDSVRTFRLGTEGIDAEISGIFDVTDAINDLKIMALEYGEKINLINDTTTHEKSGASYKIASYIDLIDVNPYLKSLGIPLSISENSFLEINFRESRNANISVYGESELIEYRDMKFIRPLIEWNGSKELGAEGILTNFILESEKQEIEGVPEISNILLEGIWFNNTIDLSTSASQKATKTAIRLKSNAQLKKDTIRLKFEPSQILLFGDRWKFNPENSIEIHQGNYVFENVEIYDETESVGIDGVYSTNEKTFINVLIEQLKLDKVKSFTSLNIDGFIDGGYNFFRNDSSEAIQFDGGFKVADFMLNEVLIGDINGETKWDTDDKSIFTNVSVDRDNIKSVNLSGYYYPLRKNDQLDFQLTFDQADIGLAQPFLEGNITNLRGDINGTLNVKGTTSNPLVTGISNVKNGGLTLNYLNTSYSFEGDVRFFPKDLIFENFYLTDRKEKQAIVGGGISHKSFSDLFLDINIDAQNFQFLNTTSVDNSLYYGTANGSGVIRINGTLNDLLIKASVKTDADTRFYIPIDEGGDVSQEEYISFVNFSDSTKQKEEGYAFSGLTFDFDIEVTPQAYCELIFDIKTGDIIRGRGQGNLKLTLDTDGEFHMFGPLEITEGAYNFTVQGFINKEFEVIPGSRITWFGDPYNAVIELSANYQQRASLEELKSEEDQAQSELSNKFPINVLMDLGGNMLSPEIGFALEIDDDANVDDASQATLAQINNDEQELRRQVISLLLFKRFSPQSSFSLSGGGGIGGSVSEFISNQVSYLVSQLDENLEVEVDLASLDEEAFNTFQLRLAYTFLDGRLTVTRGGGFSSEQEADNQVLKDIVGDWSLEYSLTGDGRLRAKVFSTTNQDITSNQNERSQDTGVSLRFVHSFNDFSEILSSSRQQAIQRQQKDSKKMKKSTNSDSNSIR